MISVLMCNIQPEHVQHHLFVFFCYAPASYSQEGGRIIVDQTYFGRQTM